MYRARKFVLSKNVLLFLAGTFASLFGHTVKVVSNFIQAKASKAKSNRRIDTESTTTKERDVLRDGVQIPPRGDRLVQRSGSRTVLAKPLVLHNHVFKVSRAHASVLELREWIVDAASGQNCPGGFHFPAVDQTVSNAWIEAYNAMDVLKKAEPCALWSKAVDEFSKKMGGNLPDAGALLLRAMQHREAEGGVLLSFANASAPAAADLLHLDPAWLIELVRRLADHNLVDKDEKVQGTIEEQLRAYAKRRQLFYGPLRDIHRWVENDIATSVLWKTWRRARAPIVTLCFLLRRYLSGPLV